MNTLIDSMMEKFILVAHIKASDGQGGFTSTWEDGAEFSAALTNNTSISARIAEHDGVTSTYTVTTHKDAPLEYHEVIKRLSDGKIFRITSDYGDKQSPAVSNLDMLQVTAEKWELTT